MFSLYNLYSLKTINSLTIEKFFNAPIEVLWQAWTEPNQLKKWWGPDNVSIPKCQLELSVGGSFDIDMLAGEELGPFKGYVWPMRATYTDIQINQKLSYNALAWTEGQRDRTEISQTTEIEFKPISDNRSQVIIEANILKAGPDAKMAVNGMKAGFEQQLNKLTKYLSK